MKIDIENKVSQAMDLHSKGYNCAQKTLNWIKDLPKRLPHPLAEVLQR